MPKTEKGKSHQIRPVGKRTPIWCRYTPEELEAIIVKLAKEGHSSSKIGTILRDQHGIPLTKPIAGKTITQIMKTAGLAPTMPNDLENLLKKATRLSVHLDKNKKDAFNKHSLQLIEAKIHKLAKYYKREELLPQDWKYETKTASLV
jgi:small subunit ribosomal protein S15